MLLQSSRYADTTTTRDVMLVTPAGTQVRTLYRQVNITGLRNTTQYIWRAGDRIDRLATQFLGDPGKYWQIMDLNPEIPNPGDIAPGTILRVPSA